MRKTTTCILLLLLLILGSFSACSSTSEQSSDSSTESEAEETYEIDANDIKQWEEWTVTDDLGNEGNAKLFADGSGEAHMAATDFTFTWNVKDKETVEITFENGNSFQGVWNGSAFEYAINDTTFTWKPNRMSANDTDSAFTNAFGTPTTKCAHSGCNNYIASSGDTNCCEEHSNKCADCGKYIDEDAMYCMDCLNKAKDAND